MSASQAAQLDRLKQSIAVTRAAAEEMRRQLTPGLLQYAPGDGGWTVGQVFEHLILSHGLYRERLQAIITKASVPQDSGEPASDHAWKPSWFGGMLARAVTAPSKRRAPRIFVPPPQPRADVIGVFLKCQGETAALLDASARLKWQKMRLSSPVSALIRMNLGDVFTILIDHDARHFRQIERIRSGAGFPSSR